MNNDNVMAEEVVKLNKMAEIIHAGNVTRGFYDNPVEFGTNLMLVTSELAEALEADRKCRHAKMVEFEEDMRDGIDFKKSFEYNIKDTVEDEIADAMIRMFDIAGYMGIDISKHIALKLNYNATRGYKHGKNY